MIIVIIIMQISPGWPVGGLSEFFTGERQTIHPPISRQTFISPSPSIYRPLPG